VGFGLVWFGALAAILHFPVRKGGRVPVRDRGLITLSTTPLRGAVENQTIPVKKEGGTVGWFHRSHRSTYNENASVNVAYFRSNSICPLNPPAR
jgi:hypothetical protein